MHLVRSFLGLPVHFSYMLARSSRPKMDAYMYDTFESMKQEIPN